MADQSSREAEARSLLAQAEDRLKGSFWERIGFGDSKAKFQDAAELFNKAANNFKLAKKADLAADAYAKAANCFMNCDMKHDAATAYANAASTLRKTNNAESLKYLKLSADIYLDEGRFSIAAQRYKEMGEIAEEDGNIEQACDYFTRAAELYEGENSTSNANSMMLKVAHHYGKLEKFDKAAEIFEQCAAANVDNKLISYSLPEYYFKAAICRLAMGDVVGVKKALEKYSTQYYGWSTSREAKLINEIIAACDNYDVDAFTTAVQNFDSISRLDPWKTSVLLKVKETIHNPEEGLA